MIFRTALAGLLLAAPAVFAAELPRANAPCAQNADPMRWMSAGTPDAGANPPLISAHRGGINLAPENTLWAYTHAFAYEMDFVEIDVRESIDGVFYSMHDDEVARTTGGTGTMSQMTSFQIDALNAANFAPWKGTEYDPSPVPRLEDILALAKAAGKGIEFDIKFVKNYPLLFKMAQDAGVATRSFHNINGDSVTAAQALDADVRVIFNIAGTETPQAVYDETDRSTVYGSRRDKFTPEFIAAIHDGCSLALPHTYDEGEVNEAAEFLLARAAGADGGQVNQPDVIRGALNAPLTLKLAPDAAQGANAICLTNAGNGLGLPYKPLTVTTRDGTPAVGGATNRFGCFTLPGAPTDYVVTFTGDDSAKAAQHNTLLSGVPSATPSAPNNGVPTVNTPPSAAGLTSAPGRFGGAPGFWLLMGLALMRLLGRGFASARSSRSLRHLGTALVSTTALLLSACGDSGLAPAPVATLPTPTMPPSIPAPAPNPAPAPEVIAKVCDAYTGPALESLTHYEGLMHEHSSYSDGDPSKIPADYFQIAGDVGYDFVGSSEHSDSLDPANFVALHASCDVTNSRFDPTQLENCFLNPTSDNIVKWASTQTQAQAASADGTFRAIRGFEWTSDVFGHINVYFSSNFTNAKTDGGYAVTMDTFWDWFTRDPSTPGAGGSVGSNAANGGGGVPNGGGSDALAHFNHPGDKCQTDNDPTGATNNLCDWNDYELIPAAVERMFGMELYNTDNRNDRYHERYTRALNKGWKLSPVGSEDEHFGQYALATTAKTATLSESLSEADFKAAWLARRTYALTSGQHLRAKLLADQNHPMGSTLSCPASAKVPLDVSMTNQDGTPFEGEYRLFGNGPEPLEIIEGRSARFMLTAPAAGEPARWYFVRVHGGPENQSVAYLAPVWLEAR